jgi:hypothetical protein
MARAAGLPREAVALTRFAQLTDPALLPDVHGIVVNPNIGETAGAQLGNCSGMQPMPLLKSARCVQVPNTLEKEAETFAAQPPVARIGHRSRQEWKMDTHEILTHEVEHARFRVTPPAGIPATDQISRFELGELNSILSQYPLRFRAIMGEKSSLPEYQKENKVRYYIWNMFDQGEENIHGILTKLRCLNPCEVVNDSVKKVFEAQSAHWTQHEIDLFLEQAIQPVWDLEWPEDPLARRR